MLSASVSRDVTELTLICFHTENIVCVNLSRSYSILEFCCCKLPPISSQKLRRQVTAARRVTGYIAGGLS